MRQGESPLTDDEPQTTWTSLVLLEQFRAGDESAADALFARYFNRLTALARRRFSSRLSRRADPEDVVLSVYRSFFKGARADRFSLSRGGDLWRLLAAITKHKVLRQLRHATADRRSLEIEVSIDEIDEAQIPAKASDPTPEEALALADELGWILGKLDPSDRPVLELRLQGLELLEIAQQTRRSERTVRRTLAQVRDLMLERRDDPGPLLSHQDFLLQRMIGAGQMGKVYRGVAAQSRPCGRREVPAQVATLRATRGRAIHQ